MRDGMEGVCAGGIEQQITPYWPQRFFIYYPYGRLPNVTNIVASPSWQQKTEVLSFPHRRERKKATDDK